MLKNKKTMMILAIVVFGTLFGGILAVSAATNWLSGQQATPAQSASFYELAYAKATSEQKVELDKIITDEGIGLPGEWRRPVLITIGDLPKDQPRLTAEQAGKLYDTKDRSALESEFNKIAGAPDFVGGSGIERAIYYLNDNRTEAIYVMEGNAFHVVFNNDGSQTTIPLGNQQLPVNPGPSTSPQGIPQTRPVQPSPTEMPMPSPT